MSIAAQVRELRTAGLGAPAILATLLLQDGVAPGDLADILGRSSKQIDRTLAQVHFVLPKLLSGTKVSMDGTSPNGNVNDPNHAEGDYPSGLDKRHPQREPGLGMGLSSTDHPELVAQKCPKASPPPEFVQYATPLPDKTVQPLRGGRYRELVMESWLTLPGVEKRDLASEILRVYDQAKDVPWPRLRLYAEAACDCTRAMRWRGRVNSPLAYCVAMVEQMIVEQWAPGTDLKYWGKKGQAAGGRPRLAAS